MLVGTGRRVIPKGYGEGQQVPLGRALRVVEEQTAESGVEAFIFAEHSIRPSGVRSEGDGKWDDQRRVLALRHEFVGPLHDPVGVCIDLSAVRRVQVP